MIRGKKLLSTILTIGVIASMSTSVLAADRVNYIKTADTTLSDVIYVPDNSITDKEAYGEEIDNIITKEKGRSPRGTYSISDKDTATHNGSTLYSQFSSTIDWDYIKSSKVSGSSSVAWLGSNPHNADRITLTDKISFGGVVIGVSTSGASWSTTMTSATWSQSLNNQWRMDHIYSNISCTGYDLYVKQVTTGDFKFGTIFYTTSATASKFL